MKHLLLVLGALGVLCVSAVNSSAQLGSPTTAVHAGTTTANVISNYTVGADAFWRFNIQNGALAAVPNTVTIKVNKKAGL